jgi:predicted enzyme related to lactoylglutathione lyase
MNLNNVMIGSDDPGRLVAYYTKLFGEPAFSEEGFSGWDFGSASLWIGAHSEVHGRNPQPGRHLLNFETTDVEGDFARMQAAGAIVVREPYTFENQPGAWVATLEDPDGNYFQLVAPMRPDTSS